MGCTGVVGIRHRALVREVAHDAADVRRCNRKLARVAAAVDCGRNAPARAAGNAADKLVGADSRRVGAPDDVHAVGRRIAARIADNACGIVARRFDRGFVAHVAEACAIAVARHAADIAGALHGTGNHQVADLAALDIAHQALIAIGRIYVQIGHAVPVAFDRALERVALRSADGHPVALIGTAHVRKVDVGCKLHVHAFKRVAGRNGAGKRQQVGCRGHLEARNLHACGVGSCRGRLVGLERVGYHAIVVLRARFVRRRHETGLGGAGNCRAVLVAGNVGDEPLVRKLARAGVGNACLHGQRLRCIVLRICRIGRLRRNARNGCGGAARRGEVHDLAYRSGLRAHAAGIRVGNDAVVVRRAQRFGGRLVCCAFRAIGGHSGAARRDGRIGLEPLVAQRALGTGLVARGKLGFHAQGLGLGVLHRMAAGNGLDRYRRQAQVGLPDERRIDVALLEGRAHGCCEAGVLHGPVRGGHDACIGAVLAADRALRSLVLEIRRVHEAHAAGALRQAAQDAADVSLRFGIARYLARAVAVRYGRSVAGIVRADDAARIGTRNIARVVAVHNAYHVLGLADDAADAVVIGVGVARPRAAVLDRRRIVAVLDNGPGVGIAHCAGDDAADAMLALALPDGRANGNLVAHVLDNGAGARLGHDAGNLLVAGRRYAAVDHEVLDSGSLGIPEQGHVGARTVVVQIRDAMPLAVEAAVEPAVANRYPVALFGAADAGKVDVVVQHDVVALVVLAGVHVVDERLEVGCVVNLVPLYGHVGGLGKDGGHLVGTRTVLDGVGNRAVHLVVARLHGRVQVQRGLRRVCERRVAGRVQLAVVAGIPLVAQLACACGGRVLERRGNAHGCGSLAVHVGAAHHVGLHDGLRRFDVGDDGHLRQVAYDGRGLRGGRVVGLERVRYHAIVVVDVGADVRARRVGGLGGAGHGRVDVRIGRAGGVVVPLVAQAGMAVLLIVQTADHIGRQQRMLRAHGQFSGRIALLVHHIALGLCGNRGRGCCRRPRARLHHVGFRRGHLAIDGAAFQRVGNDAVVVHRAHHCDVGLVGVRRGVRNRPARGVAIVLDGLGRIPLIANLADGRVVFGHVDAHLQRRVRLYVGVGLLLIPRRGRLLGQIRLGSIQRGHDVHAHVARLRRGRLAAVEGVGNFAPNLVVVGVDVGRRRGGGTVVAERDGIALRALVVPLVTERAVVPAQAFDRQLRRNGKLAGRFALHDVAQALGGLAHDVGIARAGFEGEHRVRAGLLEGCAHALCEFVGSHGFGGHVFAARVAPVLGNGQPAFHDPDVARIIGGDVGLARKRVGVHGGRPLVVDHAVVEAVGQLVAAVASRNAADRHATGNAVVDVEAARVVAVDEASAVRHADDAADFKIVAIGIDNGDVAMVRYPREAAGRRGWPLRIAQVCARRLGNEPCAHIARGYIGVVHAVFYLHLAKIHARHTGNGGGRPAHHLAIDRDVLDGQLGVLVFVGVIAHADAEQHRASPMGITVNLHARGRVRRNAACNRDVLYGRIYSTGEQAGNGLVRHDIQAGNGVPLAVERALEHISAIVLEPRIAIIAQVAKLGNRRHLPILGCLVGGKVDVVVQHDDAARIAVRGHAVHERTQIGWSVNNIVGVHRNGCHVALGGCNGNALHHVVHLHVVIRGSGNGLQRLEARLRGIGYGRAAFGGVLGVHEPLIGQLALRSLVVVGEARLNRQVGHFAGRRARCVLHAALVQHGHRGFLDHHDRGHGRRYRALHGGFAVVEAVRNDAAVVGYAFGLRRNIRSLRCTGDVGERLVIGAALPLIGKRAVSTDCSGRRLFGFHRQSAELLRQRGQVGSPLRVGLNDRRTRADLPDQLRIRALDVRECITEQARHLRRLQFFGRLGSAAQNSRIRGVQVVAVHRGIDIVRNDARLTQISCSCREIGHGVAVLDNIGRHRNAIELICPGTGEPVADVADMVAVADYRCAAVADASIEPVEGAVAVEIHAHDIANAVAVLDNGAVCRIRNGAIVVVHRCIKLDADVAERYVLALLGILEADGTGHAADAGMARYLASQDEVLYGNRRGYFVEQAIVICRVDVIDAMAATVEVAPEFADAVPFAGLFAFPDALLHVDVVGKQDVDALERYVIVVRHIGKLVHVLGRANDVFVRYGNFGNPAGGALRLQHFECVRDHAVVVLRAGGIDVRRIARARGIVDPYVVFGIGHFVVALVPLVRQGTRTSAFNRRVYDKRLGNGPETVFGRRGSALVNNGRCNVIAAIHRECGGHACKRRPRPRRIGNLAIVVIRRAGRSGHCIACARRAFDRRAADDGVNAVAVPLIAERPVAGEAVHGGRGDRHGLGRASDVRRAFRRMGSEQRKAERTELPQELGRNSTVHERFTQGIQSLLPGKPFCSYLGRRRRQIHAAIQPFGTIHLVDVEASLQVVHVLGRAGIGAETDDRTVRVGARDIEDACVVQVPIDVAGAAFNAAYNASDARCAIGLHRYGAGVVQVLRKDSLPRPQNASDALRPAAAAVGYGPFVAAFADNVAAGADIRACNAACNATNAAGPRNGRTVVQILQHNARAIRSCDDTGDAVRSRMYKALDNEVLHRRASRQIAEQGLLLGGCFVNVQTRNGVILAVERAAERTLRIRIHVIADGRPVALLGSADAAQVDVVGQIHRDTVVRHARVHRGGKAQHLLGRAYGEAVARGNGNGVGRGIGIACALIGVGNLAIVVHGAWIAGGRQERVVHLACDGRAARVRVRCVAVPLIAYGVQVAQVRHRGLQRGRLCIVVVFAARAYAYLRCRCNAFGHVYAHDIAYGLRLLAVEGIGDDCVVPLLADFGRRRRIGCCRAVLDGLARRVVGAVGDVPLEAVLAFRAGNVVAAFDLLREFGFDLQRGCSRILHVVGSHGLCRNGGSAALAFPSRGGIRVGRMGEHAADLLRELR